MNLQYWSCVLTAQVEDGKDLPNGADLPLRHSVIEGCMAIGVSAIQLSSGWGVTERHAGILKSRLEQDKAISERLFNHIKHGDDDHQKWLKDELDKFFNVSCKPENH